MPGDTSKEIKMSNNEEQVEQVEMSIEQAKTLQKRRDALNQLQHNPFWKTLINETYLKTEAVRLVLLKSDAATQVPHLQEAIDKEIIGIGVFRQFLSATLAMGNQADGAMAGHQETLDELRDEGPGQDDDEAFDALG